MPGSRVVGLFPGLFTSGSQAPVAVTGVGVSRCYMHGKSAMPGRTIGIQLLFGMKIGQTL